MALKVGDKAPDFELTTKAADGPKKIKLSSNAGNKNTVLLLSDYEHKVAQNYGIAYTSFLPEKNLGMGGVPKRSAFVVDKQGVIRYAESNDNPGQLPNFDAIKQALSQLK